MARASDISQGAARTAQHNARQAALKVFVEGTRCRYCRKRMYSWMALDLDHVIPRRLGGINSRTVLTHARCNRAAGARLRNRLAGRGKRKYSRW